MSSRFVCLLTIAVLILSLAALSQAPATGQTGTSTSKPVQIHKTTAPYTDPSNGKAMYDAYCASCHGIDGKGDGPAASALKVPPTDLTTLAAKNNGEFPSAHVEHVITGESMMAAHGGKDMPVWGPVFLSLGQRNSAQVLLRARNLTLYLKSLQQK